MDRQPDLPALIAAADDAYRLVRIDIINDLPPGASIDVAMLTPHQRRALNALNHAEDVLARYREQAYATG